MTVMSTPERYPARVVIDFPDRDLDRVSTALRLFYAIPIVIVLAFLGGNVIGDASEQSDMTIGALGGGAIVVPAILMIVFRQKYPRWWFDFNLELARFSTRVGAYLALMTDRYPSTDEEQSIHLEVDYPNVER